MAALPECAPSPRRGYAQLYHNHVTQADQGADFDFMQDQVVARRLMENDRAVVATGRVVEAEEPVLQPDGTLRYWSSRSFWRYRALLRKQGQSRGGPDGDPPADGGRELPNAG